MSLNPEGETRLTKMNETVGGMTEFLAAWAERNECELTLQGECGFGRECVGILRGGSYVDYDWVGHDCIGGPGQEAPDAYHKHPCMAVLGRGDEAITQLYRWVKRLDSEGIAVKTAARPADDNSFAAVFGGSRTRAVLVRV